MVGTAENICPTYVQELVSSSDYYRLNPVQRDIVREVDTFSPKEMEKRHLPPVHFATSVARQMAAQQVAHEAAHEAAQMRKIDDRMRKKKQTSLP